MPTDEEIHKVIALHTDDSVLLSNFNLLFHVGDQLVLKKWHENDSYEAVEVSEKESQPLLIEGELGLVSQGYLLKEIYCHEKSDGRFAIWWEKTTGAGRLVFYTISQEDTSLQLSLESVGDYSSVEYDHPPFKVVHRISNAVNEGAWLVLPSSQDRVETYTF